jgi:hypothetical protein
MNALDMKMMEVASAQTPSNKQQLFLRYFTAILIDLTVLNLFVEYWAYVVIDSFTISLLAAVMLQVLLKLALLLEHRVAVFFSAKQGAMARFVRVLSAWLILFASKFIILGAINLAFGDRVSFTGPLHGVVAFIVVVMTMLAAEELIVRFYRSLS